MELSESPEYGAATEEDEAMKDANVIEGSVEFHIGKLTSKVDILEKNQERMENKIDKILGRLSFGGWVLLSMITASAVGSFIAYLTGAFTGAG